MWPAATERVPAVTAVLATVPVVVRLLFASDRVPDAVVIVSVPITSEPTWPPVEVYWIQVVALVSTTSWPGSDVHR